MLVKIEARILIFPGTDFHFPSTSVPPGTFLGSDKIICSLGSSRLVSALNSGAEGPGFKSQPRRCRVTVLGKLFTLIVPLFTKQQNW